MKIEEEIIQKENEDLEEAAKKAATWHSINGDTFFPNDYYLFKKGAQWQKEHLLNKVCDYIKDNLHKYLYVTNGEAGFPTAEFLKTMRKDLKE